MAIPDVQVTPAEVREIVLRELRNSDLAVLVRQLQGRTTGGVAQVTWGGASPFSNVLTLGHGLPVTPTTVQATADLPGGAFAFEMVWQSFDSTNVVWRGHTTDGTVPVAATSRSFAWFVSL